MHHVRSGHFVETLKHRVCFKPIVIRPSLVVDLVKQNLVIDLIQTKTEMLEVIREPVIPHWDTAR